MRLRSMLAILIITAPSLAEAGSTFASRVPAPDLATLSDRSGPAPALRILKVECCNPTPVGPGAPSLPAPYLAPPQPAAQRAPVLPHVPDCQAQLAVRSPSPNLTVTCVPATDGSGNSVCSATPAPPGADASSESRARANLALIESQALGCR